MASINSDGSLHGKHGNSVYYKRKGKTIVRAYVPHKESKTLKQLNQRAKLKAASAWLKQFKKIINLGYQGPAEAVTPMNEAISWHVLNALLEITPSDSPEPVFKVDTEKAMLSRGTIEPPDIYTCIRTAQTLSLTWNNALGDVPNRLYDNLVLVAYIPGKRVYVDYFVGDRQTGEGTTILPDELDTEVYVWVFYLNGQKSVVAGKENVSDSVYLRST